MELLQKRFSTGDESTLGLMFKAGEYDVEQGRFYSDSEREFRCFTMEDQPNEPKIQGKTRIPAGRYKIELRTEGGMTRRYAKKFDWHRGMLWLRDVPNFKFVYIHYGNYHENTDGCILTGDGAQSNVLEDGMVTNSVIAYTRLYAEIIEAMDAGEEVFITIEEYA